MHGIPPVLDQDSEDVAWALQTAETLWLRNERVDAIVWLRRAAQAAGDANDNDRALSLARAAVDLSEWLTGQNAPTQPRESARVNDSIEELLRVSADVDGPGLPFPLTEEETRELRREVSITDLDRPLMDDAEELTETVTAVGAKAGKVPVAAAPPRDLYDDDVVTSAGPLAPAAPARTPQRKTPVVPPAKAKPPAPVGKPPKPPAVKPLPPRPAVRPPEVAPARPSQRPSAAPVELGDADLVTLPPSMPATGTSPVLTDSQTIHLPAGDPGDSVTQRLSSRPPDDLESSVAAHVEALEESMAARTMEMESSTAAHVEEIESSVAAHVEDLESSTAAHVQALEDSVLTSVNLEESVETMVHRRPADAPQFPSEPPPAAPTVPRDIVTSPPPSGIAPEVMDTSELMANVSAPPPLPTEDLSDLAADPDALASRPPRAEKTTHRPVDVHQRGGKSVIDLEGVDALSDIPDDERDAFAAEAKIHELGEGDELGGFALALVISGDVDVVATVLDASERLPVGAVMRGRGTNDKGFELKLACASKSARVATWPTAPVEAAFRSCPWVEDDLRIATDRIQALVGITSGPLADRLDASLRGEVVAKMATRALAPGEVLFNKGEPVPGLFVVGVGGLELVDDGAPAGEVIVGDFVFPSQVLGAGAAPHGVRAPRDGAVVLYADRKAAQELLVTCPPLLEILAGM